MLTDPQMNHIEGCIRSALQKINRARAADGQLREFVKTPSRFTDLQVQVAKKEGRYADMALTNALDELKDELAKLPLSTSPAPTWPVPPATQGIQS